MRQCALPDLRYCPQICLGDHDDDDDGGDDDLSPGILHRVFVTLMVEAVSTVSVRVHGAFILVAVRT
jgi:hypothetical protein